MTRYTTADAVRYANQVKPGRGCMASMAGVVLILLSFAGLLGYAWYATERYQAAEVGLGWRRNLARATHPKHYYWVGVVDGIRSEREPSYREAVMAFMDGMGARAADIHTP